MNNENSKKPVLGSPKTAQELLEIYFLDMRSGILETAAALDRIQRSENGTHMMDDPRVQKLNGAFEILRSGNPDRTGQILRLLSDSVEQ